MHEYVECVDIGPYVHKNVRIVRSDKCLVRDEPDPSPAELGDLGCDMRQCAAWSKVTGLWRRGESRVKTNPPPKKKGLGFTVCSAIESTKNVISHGTEPDPPPLTARPLELYY